MHPSYFDWGFGGKYFTAQAAKTMIYDGNSRFETSSSETIINNGAQNYDTRIEGQTDANLFFTDASTDRVGIGTNTPSSKLHVLTTSSSAQKWQRSTHIFGMELGGGDIGLYDYVNSQYGFRLTSTQFCINESAANLDTRIEGQTDANLFFTDASTDRVGIGTNTPSSKFHVEDSGQAYIKAESTASDAGIQITNALHNYLIYADSSAGDLYFRSLPARS